MAITGSDFPLRDLCATCEWVEAVREVRGKVVRDAHVCFFNRVEFPIARNCPEFNPLDDLEGGEE